MTLDPELNEQLTDDLAVQGASKDDHPLNDANGAPGSDSDEEADEMEEAQEEAAEERKEGGYQ